MASSESYKDRIVKLLATATSALSRKASVKPAQGIEDEPVEPLHHTKNGNAIEPWFHSGWHSDPTGRYEYREHVGRSVEGYHGGLEISPGGGEGPFYWSDAFPREDKAHSAAIQMAVNWLDGAAVEPARDGETKTVLTDRDALPFRFRKPWAHVASVMTEEERDTVNGIETRWRERYESFKDYPPVAEYQVHQRTVFRTIDRLYEALDAREHAPFEDWKRLEADVEKAFRGVREAFSWQREATAAEISEIDRWQEEDLTHPSSEADANVTKTSVREASSVGHLNPVESAPTQNIAITIQSSGDWSADPSGRFKSRTHLGKSAEGWHGGLETLTTSSEPFRVWSTARDSEPAARRKAEAMREDWADFSNAPTFKTAKGNEIVPVWVEGWNSHGDYVSCEHVGRSAEGFHGGVSFSWKQEDIETVWRKASGRFEDARKDAEQLRINRSKTFDKIARERFHDWDR